MYKNNQNRYIFSPSDLSAFLSCPHTAILNRLFCDGHLSTDDKVKDSGMNEVLQDKGIQHEQSILERYRKENKRIAEIPDNDINLDDRVKLTKEAMIQGADVIYQGAFFDTPWHGFSDFLIKCDTPSKFGDYSYEVIDAKLSKTAKPEHIIQLCAYRDMLAKIQGILPENIHIMLGNGERQSFETGDFFYYYLQTKQRFENLMRAFPEQESQTPQNTPDPCRHCAFCHWRNYCDDKRKKSLHLSLIANIRKSQMNKLRASGVMGLMDFIKLGEGGKVKNLTPEMYQKIFSQASLQMHKINSGEDKYEIIEYGEGKGFLRLPASNDGDVFFDMEGDPLQGLEYLFGIRHSDGKFKAFWAHDEAEEKQAFKEFMDFVGEHLDDYPHAHIYHYGHYEVSALKRLSCKHAVCEEQLDNLLRQQKFVDLFTVTREAVRTSQPGYSIKDMEVFYQKERSGSITNAEDSVVQYQKWIETQSNKILQDIEDYNKADCESTEGLRDWLVQQKPKDESWFMHDIASDEDPQRQDWEIEYEKYREKLCPENTKISPLRVIVADMLEFHRREKKVYWWNMFDRQSHTHDELMEDAECLGNMIQESYENSGGVGIFTYHFEPQDYKLKVGSEVINALTTIEVGEIEYINDNLGIVKLKSEDEELPLKLSIAPGNSIDHTKLRKAIYRYADKVLNDSADDLAITKLLKRSLPDIIGKKPDEPVIKGDNMLAEASKAIANLNNSYIFMQGPPGTGKTYSSAHIIVDLIKSDKKIGITSNSHKAIHNLLEQIEKFAAEKNVTFKGVKKASGYNLDSFYKEDDESCSISNVVGLGNVDFSADIFAGTAWFFCEGVMNEELDYLFIDEAGQVSLANLVAMSGCARNIVLVGDQMQLGQPIQGTHPGEAGQSILEFLLQGEETIAENRGIFLNESHRMRPEICDFISKSFYDGRLQSHDDAKKRMLRLQNGTSLQSKGVDLQGKGADLQGKRANLQQIELPDAGIVLINADHCGCSQKSEEEGKIVLSLYKQLLGQPISIEGETRTITEYDILIVAPYNVQVNHLQSLLPDARVGTVDKFQGQEAAIVLVSMTTSGAEDLPRNVEFLYSRNRMNVAISRAQCLTVVIANPQLDQAPASNVQQMRLINGLCRLREEAYNITL